jgi:hypothetical protein
MWLSDSDTIPLKIENKVACVVISKMSLTNFQYNLIVGGTKVPEAYQGLEMHAHLKAYKASIVSAVIGRGDDGNVVVWFQVASSCAASGIERQNSCHRRFRDFCELDSSLRSTFNGHQLRSNIPSLPPKEIKFLANHFDAQFIEERRWALESYLSKVVQVARFVQHPAVPAFLGMVDDVRESSFLFQGKAPLVLNAYTVIGFSHTEVRKENGDSTSNVQNAWDGTIAVGDVITKVNGASIAELSHEAVVAKLATLPAPVLVHVIGYHGVNASNE